MDGVEPKTSGPVGPGQHVTVMMDTVISLALHFPNFCFLVLHLVLLALTFSPINGGCWLTLGTYIYILKLSAGYGNPDIRDGYGYGYPSARPPSHPDFGGYGLLADIRISAGIRISGSRCRHPDTGQHPDAHRYPDIGRYPDPGRYPDIGRYPDTHRYPDIGRHRPTLLGRPV